MWKFIVIVVYNRQWKKRKLLMVFDCSKLVGITKSPVYLWKNLNFHLREDKMIFGGVL